MIFGNSQDRKKNARVGQVCHGILALVFTILPVNFAHAEVAQAPLFLGGGSVPGNMVLVPSVEWPTIESVANLDDDYRSSKSFEGYFDLNKCYKYVYNSDVAKRHFKPARVTSDRRCSNEGEWSGNYLNWATTQTIDPFRKVLTGGLRVVDTPTETWLEKARHPGQGNGFPTRSIYDANEIRGATPFNANRLRSVIKGLGTEMRFSLGNNTDVNEKPHEAFNPSSSDPKGQDHAFQLSVRVKVCDSSVGVESNCRQYSQGWKPEGLIQQNARDIRFSVFGYLNDSSNKRDGGVLRARQKYVGPTRLKEGEGFVSNPRAEWNSVTGVLYDNPDPADASATSSTIENSGVINYINKFGQLNTGDNKSKDPVSELYYTATRYLKNQGNVSAYTDMSGATAAQKKTWRDGFPVITNWDDPIAYECQANVILGIGDVNTHLDKNLPGNTSNRTGEPSMPSAVSDDDTVNVVKATNKVGKLEGIGNIGNSGSFSGRDNSAYMAGLAYDNHTVDMRLDLAGVQTASTHWVDVLENRVLEPIKQNQYFLAAKYGGFKVPEDYEPYSNDTGAPSESDWHTNGETLTPNSGSSFKRPDNYYLAGQADLMIESLREAFANITEELKSASSAVASNSTRLDTDTAVFQAAFDSSNWSGDVKAFEITEAGDVEEDATWSAAAALDDENVDISSRNILTINPLPSSAGDRLSSNGKEFKWGSLTTAQKNKIRENIDGSYADDGADRLAYLRGDRSKEQNDANNSRPYRERGSRLGDIVNSNPQFVGKQDFGYARLGALSAFNGIDSYGNFRASGNYQNRKPLIVVGANDGMLHGFSADMSDGGNGGEELFAFVPSSSYENLSNLVSPDYEHHYFVDGTPRIADVWASNWAGSSQGWRTLAVGTSGAGGNSVFALDVTDPEEVTTSSVLWEFSHGDMGRTVGQPAIVPLANGEFGVVVTSGYDTGSDDGKIWMLNVATGQPIKTFTLADSGELGTPLLADLDGDRVADRIYVGDTEGNIWRLDIEGDDKSEWGIPDSLSDEPLFTAPAGQAITAPPTSAFNEQGDHMIFVGTGSFFRVGENVVPGDPTVESFYGLIDKGSHITQADLNEQSILERVSVSGNDVLVVSDNEMSLSDSGWYLNLVHSTANGGPGPEGERVTARALVRGDRVIFPTLIPSENPCAAGGRSRLVEVNAFSGARLDYPVFDLNNDGIFDENDYVEITVDGETILVPPSMIDPGIGIIDTPAVVECVGEGCDERKIVSGSSGQITTISEKGSASRGRKAWEQYR